MKRTRTGGLVIALLGAAGALACIGAAPAQAAGGGRPLIHTVTLSGTPGDYTVTVRGQGFGGPTRAVPFSGDVSNFRIGDDAEPADGEWGYSGDANALDYRSWSRSEVVVSGLGAQPGDALVVALWNDVTELGASWAGNVPPVPASTPVIDAVNFSSLGTPVDLHIVVKGHNFGSEPRAMPYVGDLDFFSFWDGRAHCGSSTAFSAGGNYFGAVPADTVTLRYLAWSDTKIVVGGFRGSYGSGCAHLRSGDPVAVSVWNTSDTSVQGPQTAGRGLILYGIPGN